MTVRSALAKACEAYLDLMQAVRNTGDEIPLIESQYASRNGDEVSVKLLGSPKEMPGHPYPRFEFPVPVRFEEYMVCEPAPQEDNEHE